MSNKLELLLSCVCIVIALMFTGIFFPFLISTDKLSLSTIIISVLFLFFILLIGIQSIFNIFYVKWQRKNK